MSLLIWCGSGDWRGKGQKEEGDAAEEEEGNGRKVEGETCLKGVKASIRRREEEASNSTSRREGRSLRLRLWLLQLGVVLVVVILRCLCSTTTQGYRSNGSSDAGAPPVGGYRDGVGVRRLMIRWWMWMR